MIRLCELSLVVVVVGGVVVVVVVVAVVVVVVVVVASLSCGFSSNPHPLLKIVGIKRQQTFL